MKRALGLIAAGPLITLLTGLFRNPFVFSREATRYFTSYGFPFSWWTVPTTNCQELTGPGSSFFNPCQAAFSIPGFLIDTIVFAILYLLMSQVAITTYRTVRAKSKKIEVQESSYSHRPGSVLLGLSRKSAAQLWKKCPTCQREIFSLDHFCPVCGQCQNCCQGVHMRHEPAKPAH